MVDVSVGFLGVRSIFSLADGEACLAIHCLMICAILIGISDRRRVPFRALEIRHGHCNPKIQGGWIYRRMSASGLYLSYAFYPSAHDEECFPIRRLAIRALKIGISDRRRAVFRMFAISYAYRNPQIQGGWRQWRILVSGFYDSRHEDRDI